MRTGIYGEIMGAPTESLIFYFKNLAKAGVVIQEVLGQVTLAIQEKIYYEPVMERLAEFKISEQLLDEHRNQYAPENRKHRFTDDTVCMIAIAEAVLKNELQPNFQKSLHDWTNKYPEAGYGKMFNQWRKTLNAKPYNSFGNGGAMRIAPLGYLIDIHGDIFFNKLPKQSCIVTHDNPEGIRGGLAVADAIACAHRGYKKSEIKKWTQNHFYYDLERTLEEIRKDYKFHVAASSSVPEAIIAFLESHDGISAVENAISLGGDTDTQAMIAGCIADAFYGFETIPEKVHILVEKSLPEEMVLVLHEFENRYIHKRKWNNVSSQ